MLSLSAVVILGIRIPFSVVLISSIEEGSGVIAALLIPIDCACIVLMLQNNKIRAAVIRFSCDFIILYFKRCKDFNWLILI